MHGVLSSKNFCINLPVFVKKALLGSLFLFSPLMSDEKPPFLGAENDFMEDWNVFPYVQLEFIIPGIGICARSKDLPVNIEINFKASSIIFWYSFSSSLSGIYRTKIRDSDIYLGWGGGLFAANAFHGASGMMGIEFCPLTNIFFGYEKNQKFFDFGVDIIGGCSYINFPVEDAYLSVLPTMRVGWKF